MSVLLFFYLIPISKLSTYVHVDIFFNTLFGSLNHFGHDVDSCKNSHYRNRCPVANNLRACIYIIIEEKRCAAIKTYLNLAHEKIITNSFESGIVNTLNKFYENIIVHVKGNFLQLCF